MAWLLRSIDQSLRAKQARKACSEGIIFDPGRWALWASLWSCRCTMSGRKRNRPPQWVTKERSLRWNWRTSATGSIVALRSEEHTSELQSRPHLVCRLLLEKKKKNITYIISKSKKKKKHKK